MNPIARLGLELSQLMTCLSARDVARYLAALAVHTPQIARDRSLGPADSAMDNVLAVTLRSKRFVIPLRTIRELLANYDPTPTFGAVREMYAGDVYLRAFRPGLKADTVVDLGSNRGLFLLLGAVILEAKIAIGVEPQTFYDPAMWALVSANGLEQGRFRRIGKFASATAAPTAITIPQIMNAYDLEVIDFLKCDIEGGEFDIFRESGNFLNRIRNIAMELHPQSGSVAELVLELERHAFKVIVTDQFGTKTTPAVGHYLYASRSNDLAEAR